MRFFELLFVEPAPIRAIIRRLVRLLKVGSYELRYRIGALERPNYAYIIYQAAQLAAKLGQPRISILEFGVAGGNGLVWMERHAEQVEKLFPVKIEIYGFDTGGGLPDPKDYRDLPYHWQTGFFAMDRTALQAKLKRSKLVLGDVADTWKDFFTKYNPAPVAAVSHDLDFYSSTMSGLRIFDADAGQLMPRIFCYFDDTVGTDMELYSEFTGERLAIEDFNRQHENRKIGIPYYLRVRQALGGWVNQIWVCHIFDQPHYNTFISGENQQLPLSAGV